MKLKEITFNQTIKVFQVFRKVNIYGKSEKSFKDRQRQNVWHDIDSQNGYVKKGHLYLPPEACISLAIAPIDLIFLEDANFRQSSLAADLSYTQSSEVSNTPKFVYHFNTAKTNKYRIFNVSGKQDIEVHLNYNYFEIGIPERNNFKLCTLGQHQPIEIKINGKIDFSMSARRARVYKEQAYIFEYLGDFEKCYRIQKPAPSIIKTIPNDRKLIDLIKPLW